jgi:HEAT repeats
MSLRLPPFRIGDDSGETDRAPDSIPLTRAREAIAGRDRTVTPLSALRVVAASSLPDKGPLLAEVVARRELPADTRRQAAILLAYARTPESQPALLAALGDAEPRVRAAAAKALGWIADGSAYARLIAASRDTVSLVAKQAEWSARLIAHREHLAAPELPAIGRQPIVEFMAERRPVRITPARPERLRLCLNAIAARDFRLRFDPSTAQEALCGRSEWMLLLTEDAARAPASLPGRRSIAAAVALHIAEEDSYSIALIALVEPTGALIVCRSTGEALFAGSLRPDGAAVTFELQAVARPGAFPLLISGHASAGGVTAREAWSGPVTIPKRRPQPLDLTRLR